MGKDGLAPPKPFRAAGLQPAGIATIRLPHMCACCCGCHTAVYAMPASWFYPWNAYRRRFGPQQPLSISLRCCATLSSSGSYPATCAGTDLHCTYPPHHSSTRTPSATVLCFSRERTLIHWRVYPFHHRTYKGLPELHWSRPLAICQAVPLLTARGIYNERRCADVPHGGEKCQRTSCAAVVRREGYKPSRGLAFSAYLIITVIIPYFSQN